MLLLNNTGMKCSKYKSYYLPFYKIDMSVSGIIESDDIQIITAEVDKCLNFSKKCQMLIDNVKKKYFSRQKFVSKYTIT